MPNKIYIRYDCMLACHAEFGTNKKLANACSLTKCGKKGDITKSSWPNRIVFELMKRRVKIISSKRILFVSYRFPWWLFCFIYGRCQFKEPNIRNIWKYRINVQRKLYKSWFHKNPIIFQMEVVFGLYQTVCDIDCSQLPNLFIRHYPCDIWVYLFQFLYLPVYFSIFDDHHFFYFVTIEFEERI